MADEIPVKPHIRTTDKGEVLVKGHTRRKPDDDVAGTPHVRDF